MDPVELAAAITFGALLSSVTTLLLTWFGDRKIRRQFRQNLVAMAAAAESLRESELAIRADLGKLAKANALSQAWFWTDGWQEGEAEADRDLEAGRVTEFASEDEFDAYLDRIPQRSPARTAS